MRLSVARRIADALGRLEAAIGTGPAAGPGLEAGSTAAAPERGGVPGASGIEAGEGRWPDRAAPASNAAGAGSSARTAVGRSIFGDLPIRAGGATAVVVGPALVGERAGRSSGPEASPGGAGTPVSANSVDGLLQRVEAAVARATALLAGAEATTGRLQAALAHVPEGVVIADEHGAIVYRNPQAAAFVGARH